LAASAPLMEPAPLAAPAPLMAPGPLASTTPLAAPGGWPRDLELVRRTDGQRRFITLINHGETPATVQLPGRTVTVQAGDVRVIAE
jgi:hypothetical protein